MKKSCNRCRALCVDNELGLHGQGCGLGFRVKKIDPVHSSSNLCNVVVIAPDEKCTPVKSVVEQLEMGVTCSRVKNWVGQS